MATELDTNLDNDIDDNFLATGTPANGYIIVHDGTTKRWQAQTYVIDGGAFLDPIPATNYDIDAGAFT